MPVELTILNSMAGRDFEAALDRHAAWNLKQLDLKEAVYGKKITELSEAEAERAQRAIAARGLRVYCFSTTLFAGAVEEGEGAFREQHLGPLKATLAAARILRPKLIRLIDAKPAEKPAGADALDYLRSRHAWIFECYAEAVDAIAEAGFQTTIENEPGGFLDSPAAIARFFDGLGRRERVNYTWDAQNLWQSGIEPSLEVYARLKPVLAYYHVKGGRVVNGRMKATALSDAGWPVIEITRRVVAEGLSPVICLNPPHGERDGGFDLDDLTARDLAFLRREVEGDRAMSYQREYERRLKVAVVGVGSHCYRNVLPALTFLPVEVRAFCDMNLELARKTAREYGVPAVYASTAELYAKEDLDAAILCVGPAQHPPLALEALKAGLHVWLEKPPALRAAQVAEMLEHRGSKTVVVGFKKAFMPATLKARELLAQPEFGALKSLLGIFPMDVPADAAAVLAESRYTDWLGNGVHPLSLLVDVGGPVKAVTVHRGAHGGGACILEYASGAIGNFHLAAGASRAQPIENYYLFGERGHILIENGLRVVYQRGIPFQYGKSTTFAPEGLDHGALVWEAANTLATLENKALFTQGMWGELKHFCDAALAGQPATRGTLELALEVMKVYEAALKSGGRRIEL